MDKAERIWTPQEVAERYEVSERTLEDWRRRGTGPRFFRAGRHPRYRDSALAAWDKDQERQASAARA